MARFDSLSSTAQRLILRNGVSATLRRYTQTVADSSKPWRSGATVTADYSAPMVFLPVQDFEGANNHYKDSDGRTHQADIKILVAAADLTVTPTLKDKVINGSDSWTLVKIKRVAPNNQQIIFVMYGAK